MSPAPLRALVWCVRSAWPILLVFALLPPDQAAAQTPLVVTVSADASLVTEGEAAVFTLTATPAPISALAVSVVVSEETGGRRDFVAAAREGTRTVSIPASGTATLTIPTTQDWIREPDGAVTAEALSGAGYRVGDSSSASVVVADDDGRPKPTAKLVPLVVGLTTLPEGAGVTFNVVLSRSLAADETVTLPLDVGGTATRGTDYRLVCIESGPAGAGACNGIGGAGPSITLHGAHMNGHRVTGPLRIEAIRDNTAESQETVTLSLGGGTVQTLTLKEAPSSVVLSFTRPVLTLSEAGTNAQPALQMNAAPGGDIAVPLVFTDITATAGEDYTPTPTVTFVANGATIDSFNVPFLDDALCEGDETFRMAIDASKLPSGVTVGSQGSLVATIEDDDCTVTVAGGNAVQEGAKAEFTVRIDPAPVRDMDIGYAISEDAGNSREFVIAANKGGGKTVTVPMGKSSKMVSVDTVNAAGDDPDAGVTLTLNSGANYTLGNPSSASVRVFDDKWAAGHVNFRGVAESLKGRLHSTSTDGTFEVNESAGSVWVELDLSQTPETLTQAYIRERRSGTTATRKQDYTRPPLGWIANFGTRRRARFQVPIIADGIDDDRETLELEIYRVESPVSQFNKIVGEYTYTDNQGKTQTLPTHSSQPETGALGTYTLTIRDYTSSTVDDSVAVWLSQDTYEVTEGDTLGGTVHIEEPRGVDTTITLTENRGTATDGTDYAAGPYSVTIPAGSTSATFTIQTTEDEELELDEAFTVRIDDASLPAGFVTPDGSSTPEDARVTINDDEYTFCFENNNLHGDEGEEIAIGLRFSRPLPQGEWFKFTYTNLSTTDSDYTKVNAYPDRFWLPAGTKKYTLRIPIAGDTLYEPNEIFRITANVPATPLGHFECHNDVIIDDLSRQVDFQAAAYTAHEGRDAEVGIRVVERGTDDLMKLRKPVTLHIAAKGTGTATAGTDYAAGPWTLTIPTGASRGILRIPVHRDSANDDGETIDLEIKRAGTSDTEPDRRLTDANGNVLDANDHVRVRKEKSTPQGWSAGAATVTIRGASEALSRATPVVAIEAGGGRWPRAATPPSR